MTQRDWYYVVSRVNLIAPFLVVAEERGFRMAALRMHISQSTVSVQVNYDYDYDYDYADDDELRQLVSDMVSLVRRVKLVQVIFNNNFEDQGQRNAPTLRCAPGPYPGMAVVTRLDCRLLTPIRTGKAYVNRA